MSFFYWNAAFDLGIEEIDAQHRHLVAMINAMAATVADRGRLPDVRTVLGELMDYAERHFADEGRLIDESPLSPEDREQHKDKHRDFIRVIRDLLRRSDLHRAEIAERVLDFLITWLIAHILHSDRKIRPAPAADAPAPEAPLAVSPADRVLITALAETERRFRLLADHAPALIWVSDSLGFRGFANRAWTDFVGIDGEPPPDHDWLACVHPDDRDAYRALLAGRAAAEIEYRLRRPDGDYAWILEKIVPRFDAGGRFLGLIASGTDISAIKLAERRLTQLNHDLEREVEQRTAQLERLMQIDFLTGISNRRRLKQRLEEEIQRSQRHHRRLTAVFFDVDHFKRVNDGHGHAVGDVVLIRVAQVLQSGLRDCDEVGRFGGEEFIVLLIETGRDDGHRFAERMRQAVALLRFGEMADAITISAGVAEWRSGESGESLIERADHALYRAKKDGRNRCHVDPT
jgi:diguanylate cyclase (GGDEF)-like protein/hemerythrin-like metal-binding protein/PAS domain S-box-containing protein